MPSPELPWRWTDVLLLLLLELFDAPDFDALDFDEDFFEEAFAAVFFEVAAAASDGNTSRSRERGHERHDAERSSNSHGSCASKSNAVESCQRMHERDSPDEFRQSHLCSRMRTAPHVAQG